MNVTQIEVALVFADLTADRTVYSSYVVPVLVNWSALRESRAKSISN